MLESICHVECEFEINANNEGFVNTCMWMLTLTRPTIRGKDMLEMFELFCTIESTQHCQRIYGLNDAIPPKDVFSSISGDTLYFQNEQLHIM